MNISVILPHIRKFGGVRRYLSMGNCLLENGHSYTLFVGDLNEKYEWVEELGFKGNILPLKFIKDYEADVCICGDATSLPHLETANAKLKIVNVIFPPFTKYIIGQYGDALNKHVVVGNSTGWNGPLEWQDNWHTIPGAVNLQMFNPKPVEKTAKFSVLFMAKNRPWKGMQTIIEAYAKLKGSDIEWHCFDTEKHPLPEGITQHVNLPQSEMAALYSKCHCFLSCEELAGWQNTVAEAMACGLPVITTEIGTRDFAKADRTAIIVPQKDSDAVVAAITMLKKNGRLRDLLGKAAYHQIKAFSWELYTDKWVQFLEAELAKTPKADAPTPIQNDVNLAVDESVEADDAIAQIKKSFADVAAHKENVEKKGESIDIVKPETTLPTPATKPLTPAPVTKPLTPAPVTNVSPVLSGAMSAESVIKYKADRIRFVTRRINSGSKPFDKYDKYGAYHWNSGDKVYEHSMQMVSQFLNNAKLYGIQTVLDVGCGDGRLDKEIAKLGFNVYGIDTSATAIRLAAEKLQPEIAANKIRLEVKDFFELDAFPECVVLHHIIEHFHNPERVIERLSLHKPVLIVLATPLAKEDGTFWDATYHAHEYTADEFAKLVEPLLSDYQLTHLTHRPYAQFVIGERRDIALKSFLHVQQFHSKTEDGLIPIDDKDLNELVHIILDITKTRIKRGDIK